MRRLAVPAALAALLAACSVDVRGARCNDDSNCPPGEGCGLDSRCSPDAVCPAAGAAVGQACNPGSAVPSCGTSADKDKLTHCTPSGFNRSCYLWSVTDCAAMGMTCKNGGGAACACPNPGSTFYADAGSAALPGVTRTGAQTPVGCRFDRFGDALAAANLLGAGASVLLTGASATKMVFTEAGPLDVSAGVSVTSDDPGAVPSLYALAASGGTTTFLALHAGSTLSHLEIQNAGATGDAIDVACPNPADTAAVTVERVKVTGSSGGSSPSVFKAGVHDSGHCALVVNASSVVGVGDSGLFVEAAAGALTLTGNVIAGNGATQPYTLGPNEHRGGGVVFTAPLPPAVVFTGNQVYGNAWDQILVATSSTATTLNLKGGAASGDCGTTANVICRNPSTPPAGVLPFVGVFSNGAPVQVDWNRWTQQPGAVGTDVGGTGITGYNSSCPVTVTCP